MTTTPRMRQLIAAAVGSAALAVVGVSCSKDAPDSTSTTTTAPGATSSTTAGTQTGGGSGSTSGGTGTGSGMNEGDTMNGGTMTTESTMVAPPVNGGTNRAGEVGVDGVGGVVTEPPTPTVTVRPGSSGPITAGGATANGN